MNPVLLLLPALAIGITTEAWPRGPNYDCSEERTVQLPVYQRLEVYGTSLSWYVSLEQGFTLSSYVFPHSEAGRQALLANGIFDPAAEAPFTFTISGPDASAAVTADLRAGNRAVPVALLAYQDSRSVNISSEQMSSLLSEGEDFLIVFRDRDGRVVKQASIPIALLRNGLNDLSAMLARVRENMRDPPNRCGQVIEIRD